MVFDATFWSAACFIILMVAISKPLKNVIVTALDTRAADIQKELDEALRLKEEAELFLISCQRRYKEVLEEASEIMAHAEEESKRMSQEAHDALEASINKRIELASQKISNYEAAALQEIRNHSIDLAINTARSLIATHMDTDLSNALINEAIVETSKKLH